MLPALLHFALARHIREDAAGLGTMFLKPSSGKPQHWSSSLQLRTHRPLLGGSVLRRRPATRSRVCCVCTVQISEFSDAAFRMQLGGWLAQG
jgi:hypothetical protein